VIGVNIGSENGSKRYGWYIKPATMYAISAGTEHPKEAAALLNFLVNDKEMILLQGTEKGVPVNRNARTILKEEGKLRGFEYKANVSMMNNRERMGVMIPLMENATVVDTFKKMGDEYIFGRMSLSDCADQILETVHEVEGD
jgi:oligogalacturonide transport system substrate-binding protein